MFRQQPQEVGKSPESQLLTLSLIGWEFKVSQDLPQQLVIFAEPPPPTEVGFSDPERWLERNPLQRNPNTSGTTAFNNFIQLQDFLCITFTHLYFTTQNKGDNDCLFIVLKFSCITSLEELKIERKHFQTTTKIYNNHHHQQMTLGPGCFCSFC